jgi:Tfp pilus assembly ATPase PilU
LAAQLLAIISQRLLESHDKGKSLACEVLTNNERVQEWIIGGAEASTLIDIMKESEFFGMQTMDAALLRLVIEKSIELPAAVPYARNVHELRAKAMAAGIQL